MTVENDARERIRSSLGTIRPLVTMSRDGLVIGALEWGVAHEPANETATAAGRNGDLELHESGAGIVAAIDAVTKAKPVVIFAGDTVVGGRQNRIVNVTVWLPAMKKTQLPVSCLEHGRWQPGGYRFATSRKTDYLLRAKMSEQMVAVANMEAAPVGAPAGSDGGPDARPAAHRPLGHTRAEAIRLLRDARPEVGILYADGADRAIEAFGIGDVRRWPGEASA